MCVCDSVCMYVSVTVDEMMRLLGARARLFYSSVVVG